MKEQMNNERNAAMRLFGAMSGVDEKYLAACEADVGVSKSGGIVLFVRKYGKPLAAVLCLAVLGAGYLSMPINTDKSASLMENATQITEEKSVEEAAPEAACDTIPETDSKTVGAAGAPENGAVLNEMESAKEEATKQLSTATEDKKESDYDILSEKRDMTFDEVKALAVVGNYIPSEWPEGGSFTTIEGSDVAGAESAALFWTYENDWDSIVVNVENLGTEIPQWVQEGRVDVARKETYDETLYEIPYAETVPMEYHLMFQEAIFSAEDFGRECVEARIKTPSGDSGDTDTPRGRFGILYQDGEEYVLVRFNGRGTVDDIWNLMK